MNRHLAAIGAAVATLLAARSAAAARPPSLSTTRPSPTICPQRWIMLSFHSYLGQFGNTRVSAERPTGWK
jgi:hypothetical protein